MRNIAFLILLATSCLTVEAAKRRSRLEDLPFVVPTNNSSAPAVIADKLVEAPPQMTTIKAVETEDESISESNSSEESPSYDDCDVDNISFEIVTG